MFHHDELKFAEGNIQVFVFGSRCLGPLVGQNSRVLLGHGREPWEVELPLPVPIAVIGFKL